MFCSFKYIYLIIKNFLFLYLLVCLIRYILYELNVNLFSIELFVNKMFCFFLNNIYLLYVFFFKKSYIKVEYVKGKIVCIL